MNSLYGIIYKVKGIIFGRPKDYSNVEKEELNSIILSIVRDEFNASDIPIVVNMDFGHTDPKVILPLGCMMRIDPKTKECTLLESPFE